MQMHNQRVHINTANKIKSTSYDLKILTKEGVKEALKKKGKKKNNKRGHKINK